MKLLEAKAINEGIKEDKSSFNRSFNGAKVKGIFGMTKMFDKNIFLSSFLFM